jgi:spectinomycin phosphotransferase
MREPLRIAEEDLQACVQDQYELDLVTLEFLPVGHDYDAGVYRAVSERGTAYLLKVTSRPLYEPRCLVPRYLYDQGITSVVAPLPTTSGALWTKLAEWTMILYPWISGDSSLTGMTDELWKQVGSIFRRIHQITLPPGGFASLRQETFDPEEYTRWVSDFENRFAHTEGPDAGAARRTLRSCWLTHQLTIHQAVATLEQLAGVLHSRALPFVICHADLHARNLIRDQAGQVFVIDWDEVMLAPKERDFIFVRSPQADAFWQGYGQIEIDWVALTYFLWERVVQDLMEHVRNVWFREEWTEEARDEAARLFQQTLKGRSGSINAAYQASAHLPVDLTVPTINNGSAIQ